MDDLAASKTFKVVAGTLELADHTGSSISGNNSNEEILEAGTVVDGKFQILSILGQGGMGAVYRAYHLTLNKDIALKTFYSKDVNEENWQRFLLEARLIAKLQDPRIVQIFDYGHGVGGRPYYTMELLVGESLAERISRKGRLSISEAQTIFAAVADGLTTAHGQGVIHRDLKPGNIFIVCTSEEDPDKIDAVKIVDFGIAKMAGTADGAEQSQTATGVVFGSPLYMSPEQAAGLPVDARTDIYSLGCSIFEALTGTPPFKKSSAIATIMAHINDAPPALSQACPDGDFPDWLEILLARLLAKRRESRVKSCAEIPHIFAYENKRNSAQGAKDRKLDPLPDSVKASDFSRLGLKIAAFLMGLCACGGFVFFLVAGGPKPVSKIADSPTPLPQQAAEIPVVAQHTVPASVIAAMPAKFFLGKQSHNGKPCLAYDFGPNSVGNFRVGDKSKLIDCVKTVYLPDGESYAFNPGTVFFENPDLFQKFDDGSLTYLHFDPDQAVDKFGASAEPSWGDSHIHAITHIKSIQCLNFGKTSVTDACLTDLALLPKLVSLEMPGCDAFKATNLVNFERLDQLAILNLGQTVEAAQFLERAPVRRMNLQSISLKQDKITGKDIELVSRLKHLRGLALDVTDVMDADLYPLAKLQDLDYLSIGGPNLTPGVIGPLCQLKHLRQLYLSADGFDAQDTKKLRATVGRWCPILKIDPFTKGPPTKDDF